MNLPFFIARRYLLSKRKKNFINIISMISMAMVAFITAALVIVLSVFNGLEHLLRSLNNSFDPEIKIEASAAKSFRCDKALLQKIEAVPGVAVVTQVIEDFALVKYNDANQIITLKGVSENFEKQDRIPQHSIMQGDLKLEKDGVSYALVGQGVANMLMLDVGNPLFSLNIYYIKNIKPGTTDPSSMYVRRSIAPGGVFSIITNIDENYVLVPLDFAQELLNYGDRRTSLEIKTTAGASVNEVDDALQRVLGSNFQVLNQEQQHKDLYSLLKMEKLFTFLSFSLLLAIGSINIFFSLMMLALDKKKDISVMAALGAGRPLIRNIFLTEGALISFCGAFIGLLLGGAICWLQATFGLVSMGMETSVAQGYPIKMAWDDFLATLAVVSIVSFAISARPAVLAARIANPTEA